MKNKICKLLPVGISLKKELTGICIGFTVAILWSCSFLINFFNAYCTLFRDANPDKSIIEHAKMTGFVYLIDDCFTGFTVLFYLLIILAVFHYFYHYTDSKSIYTMRRLPQKSELHIRCLSVPLLGIIMILITIIFLIGIYYIIYIKITPEECLVKGQLSNLFKQIIYGGAN